MSFWSITLVVYAAGCVGGVVNAFMAGELHLPRMDRRARVWKPGWLGNVVVGGTAAVVFWGFYGPAATTELFGKRETADFVLRASELFGAVLTGIGGGRLLSAEVDRRILRSEKAALDVAKNTLADAVLSISKDRK